MKHINVALFVPHKGCPHMCSFCNQKTISGTSAELTQTDIDEAVRIATKKEYDKENSEIAFFGGSFTAIDREYMTQLLECAYKYVGQGLFKGIRCSTRPDAIDEDVLNILKEYGVTAIELGAQSTDEEVLSLNKRGHTREDIFKASQLIKANGFSLGLQMMTGLSGDTFRKSLKTADDIISIKPDTVRIYPTIVLEGTMLGEMYKKGEYKPQTTEEAVELCRILCQRFYKNNIKVIRLGLHSGGNVEEGYLSGPYHPAFGELCESGVYLNIAKERLKEIKKGKITIFVNSREISKMTGQKGSNKEKLLSEGYKVTVKGDGSLNKYEIKIQSDER